jgi:uncharacterized protein YcsI (UPF0317 family)
MIESSSSLVILPQVYAKDFKLFCEKNPQPCPLIGMLPPGMLQKIFCFFGRYNLNESRCRRERTKRLSTRS